MTNVQLYEEFILEKTLSAAPRTLQYYKENLTKFNNYVDSVLLGKPYKDITKQDYSKYLLHLKKTGIKNTSLATYHRAVRTFCNWLLDNKSKASQTRSGYDSTFKCSRSAVNRQLHKNNHVPGTQLFDLPPYAGLWVTQAGSYKSYLARFAFAGELYCCPE